MTLQTVVSGSYRKHLHQIMDVRRRLTEHGITVLAPLEASAVNPDDEFVILDCDQLDDARTLQDGVFAKIRMSSFLVVANVDGYLGNAAILEIGYAVAHGLQVFSLERVEDPGLAGYIRDLAEIVPDRRRSTDGRGRVLGLPVSGTRR